MDNDTTMVGLRPVEPVGLWYLTSNITLAHRADDIGLRQFAVLYVFFNSRVKQRCLEMSWEFHLNIYLLQRMWKGIYWKNIQYTKLNEQ